MHRSQQTSHVVCGRRVHLRGVRRVLWGYSLFQTVTCGYSICSTDFQSDSDRAIDIIVCLLQVCDEVRGGRHLEQPTSDHCYRMRTSDQQATHNLVAFLKNSLLMFCLLLYLPLYYKFLFPNHVSISN